jgi:hypothetical protein
MIGRERFVVMQVTFRCRRSRLKGQQDLTQASLAPRRGGAGKLWRGPKRASRQERVAEEADDWETAETRPTWSEGRTTRTVQHHPRAKSPTLKVEGLHLPRTV